jgi:hypothetical protein
VTQEIEYVRKHVLELPMNESPWSYLKGLFGDDCQLNPNHAHKRSVLDFSAAVKGIVAEVVEGFTEENIVYALQFLLFVLEQEGKKGFAEQTCRVLEQHDYIRTKYWKWRRGRTTGSNFDADADDRRIFPRISTSPEPTNSVLYAFYFNKLKS